MFRLEAKKVKAGHVLQDITVQDDAEDTRTHKVFHALTEVCRGMDLAEPIWLRKNIRDFQQHARCRFTKDSFVEETDFDYLEIRIVEEDWD